MKDTLKYLLLGGGALYLFSRFSSSDTGPQQPSTAPASPGVTTPPAPPQAPVYTPPPASPPPVNQLPVTDELIKRASWDYNTAILLGDRVLYNTHQWNWFREHSGGDRTNPGTDFGQFQDPAVSITALAYLNKVKQAGMAGLRGIRR